MNKKVNRGTSEGKYLTAQQAANFLGVKISYFYKLTSENKIPFYNPTGRKILCKVSELEAFIESARVPANAELEQRIAKQMMMEG